MVRYHRRMYQTFNISETFFVQHPALHASLMLPAIPYSSSIVTTHNGHRHDQFLLKTGIRGSYGARRGQSAFNTSDEVLSAAAVRQRPFIEGDSIVCPPDDSEAPVLYTHTLWYAAFCCRNHDPCLHECIELSLSQQFPLLS